MKRLAAVVMMLSVGSLQAAKEKIIKDSQGMDCYVYTPDKLDKEKVYQVVVGVHGYKGNGRGAGGYKSWADRGDVIVLGPSFVSDFKGGEAPYQSGGGMHAKKLISLFKGVQKEYKVRDKMFIAGFSGGAQFSHRFTMLHPNFVCGVAAHSGGSWATRKGFGKYSKKARGIPFAISCGEADTAHSAGGPLSRINWFKEYRDKIDKDKFTYIADSWPGVGHSQREGAKNLTAQCFQLSTGLGGGPKGKMVKISDQWKNLDAMQKPSVAKNEAKKKKLPYVNPRALNSAVKAGIAKAEAEEISSAKLVSFMSKYPPVLWKDKPGAEKLLSQCERAAGEWLQLVKSKGMWNGTTQRQFKVFSNGLKLVEEAR